MSSLSAFLIFVLLAVVPVTTLAKEYIVGDESGWTTYFDYQAWAQGKNFQVGDKLVFKYPAGVHNVFKVNGTGFHNCIIPPLDQALTTGNDTILLATPGKKWYICGVGKHCESGGQKLTITVQAYSPTPSPTAAPPPQTAIPYIPGTPVSPPSLAPSPLSPIPYTGSGSEVLSGEYDAPAPSPVDPAPWEYEAPSPADPANWIVEAPAPSPIEFATWKYYSPAPSPVKAVPWEYGIPAPSPVEAAPWEYGTPAPSPVEAVPWEYGTPAPPPVEDVHWEYSTPAPSPVDAVPWEYGTPAAPPVELIPWEYEAPAPSPAAGTGYTETAAKKRPFVNFFKG